MDIIELTEKIIKKIGKGPSSYYILQGEVK